MRERFPEVNGFPPGYEPTGPPGEFIEEIYTEDEGAAARAFEEWEEGQRSRRMLGLAIVAAVLVCVAIAWILWPR